MRSLLFVFATSLIYAQISSAEVVNLKSIFNSKATGTIAITEDKQVNVGYQLNLEEKNQAYAILVFKDGDCENFTKQVPVTINDPKIHDKNIPFNDKGNQFLLFLPGSKKLAVAGKISAPAGSFLSFEPKGKSFVLMAMKDAKSETGIARACGIYP